jgi:hypothetical protein
MSGWGWTSYHKTELSNVNGVPVYLAHFRADYGPTGGSATVRLFFCTRHPVKALRLICESGKDPIEFHDKEILP